jgi:hypothetical protein
MYKTVQCLLLILLISFNTLFAQDKWEIKRGERPEINLERVPEDSYYSNKLRIKINPSFQERLKENDHVNKEGKDFIGLENVDQLLVKHNILKINKTFGSEALKNEYEERHKAWGFHLWYEIEFAECQGIKDLIKQYCDLKEVEFAEPIYKKQLIDYNPNGFYLINTEVENRKQSNDKGKWIPNDPRFNEQWHYYNTGQQGGTPGVDIDLIDAWEIQKGNPDVIIAIIDGGIEYNHVDLQANIWSGIGYNFVTNSPTIQPHNHGTHVAGTISAVNNNGIGVSGIAGGNGGGNGVSLMSCQVFTASSNGGFEVAPVWAADNGAIISQNSWGYTSSGYYEQAVLDAIDYFNQNAGSEQGSPMSGGITIFAAGNGNSSGQWYPGCYSGVMAVAATNNQDQKSWYSNYDTWVDISAPGGETNTVTERGVLSTITGNNYAYYQGTSMACPHVTGVAALILSHAPGELSPAELKEILKETADNHYAQNPSFNGMLGTGRLNAANALGEAEGLLTGLRNPKDFLAVAVASDQIDLSWSRNENLNSIILAYNSSPTFGIPSYTMLPGDEIEGGGNIIYVGADTLFYHNDLSAVTPYFYRIWSFNEEGEISTGRGAAATTLCSNFELPFNESISNTSFPLCWSTDWEGSGSQNVWTTSNTNHAGGTTGEFRARYVSGTATSRLITPPINTTGIAQITIRFRHFYDDYSSGLTFRLQTSSNGEDWTNTEWSFTSGSGNIGPQLVELDLYENLNNPNTYFAFSITGNHYQFDYWYIDDIEIEGMPTGAPLVTSLDPQNISEFAAELWGEINDQGDEPITASGFVYSINPNPQIDNDNTIVIYTNPLVSEGQFSSLIQNLNAASTYYYRAFAINNIATSYGSQKQLTTLCGTIYLPHNQSFLTSEVPLCWDVTNNGGTAGQVWQFGSFSSGLSGSTSYAYLNSDAYGSGNNQNSDLISPPITIEGYSSITLEFKHYFRQYLSSSMAKVLYSIDGGNNWIEIQSWATTTANPTFFEFEIDNSEANSEIIFKWNYVGAYSYYWCIDDIVVTGVPAGDPPLAITLEADNIGPNSVTFNALVNPRNLNTNVFFEWGISSVTDNIFQYNQIISGQEDQNISLSIENLLPGKEYYYRVKATSVAGTTYGEQLIFGTLNDKPASGELFLDFWSSREASFSGSILSDGGSDILSSGICIGHSQNSTPDDMFYEIEGEEGAFSITVDELIPNTMYYARMYLENEYGITYSNELEFLTNLEVPSIITLDAIIFDSGTVSLNGRLISSWNDPMEDIGFLLHNISDFNQETPDVQVFSTIDYNIQQGEEFNLIIDSLTPETTYYFRTYAINSEGIGFGDIFTFTTWPLSSEINGLSKVSIYPNPASDVVNIVSPEREVVQVVICDLSGKPIINSNEKSNNSSFIINDITPGIYIIRLKYSDGFVSHHRIVIY